MPEPLFPIEDIFKEAASCLGCVRHIVLGVGVVGQAPFHPGSQNNGAPILHKMVKIGDGPACVRKKSIPGEGSADTHIQLAARDAISIKSIKCLVLLHGSPVGGNGFPGSECDHLLAGVQDCQKGHVQPGHDRGLLDVLSHAVFRGFIANGAFGAGHETVVPFNGLSRAHTRKEHTPPPAKTPQGRLGHGHGDTQVRLEQAAVHADRGPVAGHPDEFIIPGLLGIALINGYAGCKDFRTKLPLQFGLGHGPEKTVGHHDFNLFSPGSDGLQHGRQDPMGRRQAGPVVNEDENLFSRLQPL